MNAAVSVGFGDWSTRRWPHFRRHAQLTGVFEIAAVVSIITAIAIQLCPAGPQPASVVGQSGAIAAKSVVVPGG
jgi:hypothetical protein